MTFIGAEARADDSIEWQAGGKFHKLVAGDGQSSRSTARASSDDAPAPTRRAARRSANSESAVASSSSSDEAPRRKASRGTRVASLGREDAAPPRPGRSISGGGNVNWIASSSCLASNLRSAIHYVAQNYGSVTVNSTCRSPGHNRRVGGAPKSWHLTGEAADIRIHGNVGGAVAYLRSAVGGFKHYGGGLFHIDNGPKRSF